MELNYEGGIEDYLDVCFEAHANCTVCLLLMFLCSLFRYQYKVWFTPYTLHSVSSLSNQSCPNSFHLQFPTFRILCNTWAAMLCSPQHRIRETSMPGNGSLHLDVLVSRGTMVQSDESLLCIVRTQVSAWCLGVRCRWRTVKICSVQLLFFWVEYWRTW